MVEEATFRLCTRVAVGYRCSPWLRLWLVPWAAWTVMCMGGLVVARPGLWGVLALSAFNGLGGWWTGHATGRVLRHRYARWMEGEL